MRYMIYLSRKKNVPWHILAPRRGYFGNHLPLRRVRILAERFYMIGRNFLSYKKKTYCIRKLYNKSFLKDINQKLGFHYSIMFRSLTRLVLVSPAIWSLE